ncbi:MAG TPA: hypothetical protein VKU00_12505 [Chthonomonadaceae bacterium]|nr:hypothetical protein [Chthonomonadaceae bacterium]
MQLHTSTPWHKASYDRLLQERLPQLLAGKLPLGGYRVELDGDAACRVTMTLLSGQNEIEVTYAGLPQPDSNGLFQFKARPYVVLPTASQDDLALAEIRCVGEQLYEEIAARLGDAPDDLPWDEALARAWFPLDTWVNGFLTRTAQLLDTTNWLSIHTHLRRMMIPNRKRVIAPNHAGRVCPIETPEGPNTGRVLVVALGAEIRDGKLIIVDDDPVAGYGLNGNCVPFREYDEPCRLLMGVNMLRQWITPPDPEPALVQTGCEPDAPGFWCGRNLLTAYVSWGLDSFEDSIVLSESAARRLHYPNPLETGDKLSNRHGAKGVVSRILPDAEMPHLPDGTPVELVYDYMGLPSRFNFGQIREALMGRIARAEGEAAIVLPFQAPDVAELKARLQKAGLREDGQEVLRVGQDGEPLERASTVGWVYWGKLTHLAADKISTAVVPGGSQKQGWMEFNALKIANATEFLREHFHTRAAERADASTLAARVAHGAIAQADAPSPAFAELQRRLAVAGIRAEIIFSPPIGTTEAQRHRDHTEKNKGDVGALLAAPKETSAAPTEAKLAFRLAPPEGEALLLAQPVTHPWLRQQEVASIGTFKELPEYAAVVEANTRLTRMQASSAPPSLRKKAHEDLQRTVNVLFDALIMPEDVQTGARVLFSGRAVVTPGRGLKYDQVGVPDEIAWALFGPLVIRELGDASGVEARSEQAAKALDALMARSWVVLNRAPTIEPTGFYAFHPVRTQERVLRLHPFANHGMNADFDGDVLAVFLPLTAEGQKDAAEKLSFVGHLRRDPGLIGYFLPLHGARYGLSLLARSPEGRAEIARLAGVEVPLQEGWLNRTALLEAGQKLLEEQGPQASLEAFDRLMQRGFEVAKRSGLSLSPFLGETLVRPEPPQSDTPSAWNRYMEELAELFHARDITDNDIGPFLIAVKSGARGIMAHLIKYAAAFGVVEDVYGKAVPIRHAMRDGMTAAELSTMAVGARLGIAHAAEEVERIGKNLRERNVPTGFTVLARAMRVRHPGLVFARAAASGETDPLTEPTSRLFVGLPIEPGRERPVS